MSTTITPKPRDAKRLLQSARELIYSADHEGIDYLCERINNLREIVHDLDSKAEARSIVTTTYIQPAPATSNHVNTARIVRPGSAAGVVEVCMHGTRLGQEYFCPDCPCARFPVETTSCPTNGTLSRNGKGGRK